MPQKPRSGNQAHTGNRMASGGVRRQYELSFLADGRVAGIGEFKRFFGPYQVVNANGGIKIGPVASTMMACLDPNIETEFFRMFENVHLYQLDEKNLYLFVDNKIKAVFEPTDKPVDEE